MKLVLLYCYFVIFCEANSKYYTKEKTGITVIDTSNKMAGVPMKSRGVTHAPCAATWCIAVVLLLCIPNTRCDCPLRLSKKNVHVVSGGSSVVHIIRWGRLSTAIQLKASVLHSEILEISPLVFDIEAATSGSKRYEIRLFGKTVGHTEVIFEGTPSGATDLSAVFLSVTVMRSRVVKVISDIVGWIYCIAWSLSFYPQIYTNWKRKSVVGLHFDFLAMNIVGFIIYSFFNCGLYFDRAIQNEYARRFPRGHNPVHLNDVIFSVHASLVTMVAIAQTRIYERGEQRISNIMRGILSIMAIVLVVSLLLSLFGVIHWLDFLYNCSYVKLATTLVKYIPQAVMNYKRKSTAGWSIGNVLLDFTGGVMSVLQMLLNGWNYNDWISIFGDLTKFGLGLFSLSFMILFMVQHFILYRKAKDNAPGVAAQSR